MKKLFFSTLVFMLFATLQLKAQQSTEQKEILLIGLFHFNNPGADVAKTKKFDVLTQESQKELDDIAQQIKAFGADKIYTEWDYDEQLELDTLYNLYLDNQYFKYVEEKFPESSFYKENEIFQLAFRIAKLNNHKRVYGIDIQTEFPFDSLLLAMDQANQAVLKGKIFERIGQIEQEDNERKKKYGLTELILEENKKESRDFNLGSYITLFNPGGTTDNFIGVELVANWYKRNLLMYSFVQKLTEESDKKMVIILGAGHIALFKHFIDLDENYRVVELSEVLK